MSQTIHTVNRSIFALICGLLIGTSGCSNLRPSSTGDASNKHQSDKSGAETEPDVLDRAPRKAQTQQFQLAKKVDGVRIYILAAGQADSMLIVGPPPAYRTLLVDAGEPIQHKQDNAEAIFKEIKSITGTTHVNYVVLTHFHQDHAGAPGEGDCSNARGKQSGLFSLFDQLEGHFSADVLFDPGDDDQKYIPARNSVHCAIIAKAPIWISEDHLGKRLTPEIGTRSIDLGSGIQIDVVAVSGRVYDGDKGLMNSLAEENPELYSESSPASENDRSIAFFLRYGRFSMFSGGDLTGSPIGQESSPYSKRSFGGDVSTIYTNVETYLFKYLASTHSDAHVLVYRADHHGSGHSSNSDTARALQPRVVIYSTGLNSYLHPDASVIQEFCKPGITQLLTSGFDAKEWPDGLPKECATVTETDIEIDVPNGSNSFSINGTAYPIN